MRFSSRFFSSSSVVCLLFYCFILFVLFFFLFGLRSAEIQYTYSVHTLTRTRAHNKWCVRFVFSYQIMTNKTKICWTIFYLYTVCDRLFWEFFFFLSQQLIRVERERRENEMKWKIMPTLSRSVECEREIKIVHKPNRTEQNTKQIE